MFRVSGHSSDIVRTVVVRLSAAMIDCVMLFEATHYVTSPFMNNGIGLGNRWLGYSLQSGSRALSVLTVTFGLTSLELCACSDERPRTLDNATIQFAQERLLSPFTPMIERIGTFRSGYFALDVDGNGVWDASGGDRVIDFTGASTTGIPVVAKTGYFYNRVGVFDGGTWKFDWNRNEKWDGCTDDQCWTYGQAGDIPVPGDWNGDGETDLGVVRNGTWFLDTNFDHVFNDSATYVGQSSDSPVVGEWPIDSLRDRIGVFNNGNWKLDTNGNGTLDACGTDACPTFGMAGDKPLGGHWRFHFMQFEDIGVFRPNASNASWYLDTGSGTWSGCTTDDCVSEFGLATDKPLVGFWSPLVSQAPDKTFSTTTSQFWEMSSVAIPPYPGVTGCTQGRVLVTGTKDFQPTLRYNDLTCLEGTGSCTPTEKWPLPGLLAGDVPLGDPYIVRRRNPGQTGPGDVVNFRLVKRVAGPVARVVALLWISSDCGTTWGQPAVIDSLAVSTPDGQSNYGQPQPDYGTARKICNASGSPPIDCTDSGSCAPGTGSCVATGSSPGEAPCTQGSTHCPTSTYCETATQKCRGTVPAGWDRPELYADPWNGNMYVTTFGRAGVNADANRNLLGAKYVDTLLFRTQTQGSGQSWSKIATMVPGTNVVPMMMTSTPAATGLPNGRFIIFTCWNYNPVVWVSESLGTSFVSLAPPNPWKIVYWDDGSGPPAAGSPNGCVMLPNFGVEGSQSIARAGRDGTTDYIRVSYPSVVSGRQFVRVLDLTISGVGSGTAVTQANSITINSQSATGSVTRATFIDPDRMELSPTSTTSASFLYWLDTTESSTGDMSARGALVRGVNPAKWSSVVPLSVDAHGGIKTFSTWKTGDYERGAFYYKDGAMKFFTQWVDAPASGAAHSLHSNILSTWQ